MAPVSENRRIQTLIDQTEEDLAALYKVRDLLDGKQQTSSARRANGHEASEAAPPTAPTKQTRRELTAAFLAGFDRTEPSKTGTSQVSAVGRIAPLLTQGYLARKGDGYVRTAKPLVAGTAPKAPTRPASKKPGYWDRATSAARRVRTAAFLATFSPTTPTPMPPDTGRGAGGVGSLVANGYLKKKGDKFLRTAKPFVP